LDHGFESYHAYVTEDLSEAVRTGLEKHDLRRYIKETVEVRYMNGMKAHVLVWSIPTDPALNLLLVNLSITNSIKSLGATVRKSRERVDGNAVAMSIGTAKFATHDITIHHVERPADLPAPKLPQLALVIDDFGYSRVGVAAEMLEMDLPLTIAVLPNLPRSAFAVERAQKNGKCVLLHLPMESNEKYPTDMRPVTVAMADHEISDLVAAYLNNMPGIDGVNNHQGSKATADHRVMTTVLAEVSKRKLFFLDSSTSPKSVAYNTARELGIPAVRNSIFLDADTEDADEVEARLRRAVRIAKRNGYAVAIGHPHRWTLEAIRNSTTFLKGAGVELVYVSDLVQTN